MCLQRIKMRYIQFCWNIFVCSATAILCNLWEFHLLSQCTAPTSVQVIVTVDSKVLAFHRWWALPRCNHHGRLKNQLSNSLDGLVGEISCICCCWWFFGCCFFVAVVGFCRQWFWQNCMNQKNPHYQNLKFSLTRFHWVTKKKDHVLGSTEVKKYEREKKIACRSQLWNCAVQE